MVVVFEGMPVDAGVVAVTGDQRLQFGRGAGQVLDVESNVLAQAGGPGGTAAAHRREDARTDGPIFRLLGRIVRKTCGNVEREPPQQLPDTGDIGGQDGTENADTTQDTQEVTDAAEGTQESQENHDGNHSGESTDMVEGHLDPAQLEEMNKDDLKKLAKDMGVDLPRGAAKALIVERLAAAIVQTPAAAIVPPAADNGGGAQ